MVVDGQWLGCFDRSARILWFGCRSPTLWRLPASLFFAVSRITACSLDSFKGAEMFAGWMESNITSYAGNRIKLTVLC